MSNFKRSIILCVCAILCTALFFSCSETDRTGGVSSDVTTETATPENINISLEKHKFIRPELASTELLSAFMGAITEIKDATGVRLEPVSDFVPGNFANEEVTNDDPELLFGATNRKESRDALSRLKGDADYVIERVGNKVVIIGKTDEATLTALRVFIDKYLSSGKLEIPEDLSHSLILSDESSPVYQLASQYKIIRSEALTAQTSTRCFLATKQGLEAITGISVSVSVDSVIGETVADSGYVSDAKEILIGHTNRSESIAAAKELGAMDYTVQMTDTKIVIVGGTPMATLRGVEKFLELVKHGELTSLASGTLSYTEVFWDKYTINPLCTDAATFVPVWSDQYTIPDWMHDFDEKTYALTQNSLRNMSISHRGDMIYYPENSIECILSAICAGIDIIEVDIRETKDHVLILMHDETLSRTTDADEKAGKNGLPKSLNVADWTYEQLCRLNLKCNNGKQTEYKIPTYYEAMCVMKDRCFLHSDMKTNRLSLAEELYMFAEDIGCKEIFFFDGGLSMMKNYLSKNPSDADFAAYVKTIDKYFADGGKIRARYWVYTDAESATVNSRDYHLESVERWTKLRAEGKTLIWSNNPIPYCAWIGASFTASK